MQQNQIGFVGLGRMGLALSRHLIGAGHDVLGYRRGDMTEFAEAGGTPCDSLLKISEASPIVFGCLPSEAAFEEVYLSATGLLQNATAGQVFVELGTQSLAKKQEAEAFAQSKGAVLLDAEISGTPMMAQAKRAVLFVAGNEGAFEIVKPLLELMADLTFHLGTFGNANRMKLVANHLVAVHNLVTAEVLLLGERAGLDPQAIITAIENSGGGSTIFSIRAPWMAARKYEPAAGPIGDLAKYFDLIQDLADAQGTATPLLDVAAEHYRNAVADGRGHQDVAAMFAQLEQSPREAEQTKETGRQIA